METQDCFYIFFTFKIIFGFVLFKFRQQMNTKYSLAFDLQQKIINTTICLFSILQNKIAWNW